MGMAETIETLKKILEMLDKIYHILLDAPYPKS